MATLEEGDRVVVVDRGDPHVGEWGTVVRREYPAVLTGRAMVDVRLDGCAPHEDEGFYAEQLDRVRLAGAA